jgi:hypothetical protein
MHSRHFILALFFTIALAGCETRSKLVAKSIYIKDTSSLSPQCKNSLKTVKSRQIVKNSSLMILPVTTILTGGTSLIVAAAANASITLDDEINANQIAENCDSNEQTRSNRDIMATIATNSTVSAISSSVNFLNVPIQTHVE